MDNISSLQSQVFEKLKNPVYAVNFMVDNNPVGMASQFRTMGYGSLLTDSINSNKSIMKKVLLDWYNNKKTNEITEVLNNTPYLNQGDNSAVYTQGYRDYVISHTPSGAVGDSSYKGAENNNSKFSFDGLLAGLGAGLTTYGQVDAGSLNGGATSPQAQQAIIDAQNAKQKKTIWIIVGVVVGIIAIIGLVILIRRARKKS